MKSAFTFAAMAGIALVSATAHAELRSLHHFEERVDAASSFVRRRAVQPGAVRGVTVTVVNPPQPVTGNGRQQLVWELVVRNDRSMDITIAGLDVVSASSNTTIASYSGQSLITQGRVRAGELAVIYLLLSFESPEDVPSMFTHRLRLTSSQGDETYGGPLVAVRLDAPAVLSAPMRGSSWLAANGPSNDSGHRRALLTINGRMTIAQRFAIDWVQLDDRGSTFSGYRLSNASYYAYGRPVLAVADGVVTAVKDGIPENVPQQTPVVPIAIDSAPGNHVLLDIGEGRFVLYAHLQPGSLLVRPGDQVSAGTPLGLLGNSGNSTEPHLHFHLCDANSPLACEGIPYVFDHFATPDGPRRLEIPMRNAIVDFEQ